MNLTRRPNSLQSSHIATNLTTTIFSVIFTLVPVQTISLHHLSAIFHHLNHIHVLVHLHATTSIMRHHNYTNGTPLVHHHHRPLNLTPSTPCQPYNPLCCNREFTYNLYHYKTTTIFVPSLYLHFQQP